MNKNVFYRIVTKITGIVAGVNMVPKQQDKKLNKAIDNNSLNAILGHPSEKKHEIQQKQMIYILQKALNNDMSVH